jgi:integrase
MRGNGIVYRKKRRDGTEYGNWVIQFYHHGRRTREYTGFSKEKEADARKLLKVRLAEVIKNEYVAFPRRVRVQDLYDALLLHTEAQQRSKKSVAAVKWIWAHLREPLGYLPASELTTDHLNRYITQRQQEKAQPATINRELATLRRMYSLAYQATPPKVPRVPHFPHLTENNVRKGFVADAAYTQLATLCGQEGLWMRAMFEVGYRFGWRVSELLNLRVRHVDVAQRTLRLDPGMTKNKDGREAFMPQLMTLLIEQCVQGKKPEDFVFTRPDGTPVRDFRAEWWKVCVGAGVGQMTCKSCGEAVTAQQCPECKTGRRGWRYQGLIFHDLRRTAVRNMVRDHTSEKVAMSITGHKTRSVFDRYHIVDATDQKLAAQRMDARAATTYADLPRPTPTAPFSAPIRPEREQPEHAALMAKAN